VSATYGMAGGRRTKEREDVHYASTIDNLITRASKNCTANKPHRVEEAAQAAVAPVPQATLGEPAQAVVLPEGARAPRLKIHTISFSSTGAEAKAGVTLRRLDQEFKRESSGYAVGGDSILRLFAEAAAGAVCKSLAPEHGIVVEDAFVHQSGKEDEIVTVVAMYISPKTSTRLTGSALIRRGDQYRAAAAALLDAVNRLVETAPQAVFEEEPQMA
ncbi:hypothetical protein LLG39_05380, partial [bacterium]|nr:hypothetical protein [bacterium]